MLFVCRCCGWYWWRRYSNICHDHHLRCSITQETWHLPGNCWNGGRNVQLSRSTAWRYLLGEGLVAMVFRKSYS
jgi:hypothetical protein